MTTITTPTTDLVQVNLDLTVFGDAPVIETRLPRAVYGRLHVDQDVLVCDDSVEPRRYRITELTNDGRDVRLVAV